MMITFYKREHTINQSMSSQRFIIIVLLFTHLLTTIHLQPPMSSAQPIRPDPASTAATIPVQTCKLDLPDKLFHDIKSSCASETQHNSAQLYRSRCCPVLASWLYSAYSETALALDVATITKAKAPSSQTIAPAPYDMPAQPNDSGSCVGSLITALDKKGVSLPNPNTTSTCDVILCECGIRLQRLSCPEAFRVNSRGKLIGGEGVKKLETACFNKRHGAGLTACNRCLNALRSLNERSNRSNERSSAIHSRNCELMGLTWLLNKNRSAYMRTVSAVLKATMTNTGDDASEPRTCTPNKPFAADTNNQSSSTNLRIQHLLPLSLFCMPILVLFTRY